jgi:glycolate oxidase
MALTKDIIREFEDVLGPENFSDDPTVVDTYSYAGWTGVVGGWLPEDKYFFTPGGVALPGSTEDVQKIIKLCNKHGITSRAFSTGYAMSGAASGEDQILIDLRRMNRILDIDEKNMRIIVEPYVTFAQVQGEVMKRGLNTHVIGAGSNCSCLASHTSMHGTNTQAISMGWSGRKVLGVEWVLPTGEILRLGAPGSGVGWFSADGPGPSLRGIMRGASGARGGLGVFTKVAFRLNPWNGPTKIQMKGTSPDYETEIPPNFDYHLIEWPSWDKCADGMYKIGEAGIAMALHKTAGPGSHGATVTGSNNEYHAKWEELKDIPWISFAIVTASNSPAQHAYQAKTLARILEETEGKFLPLGENPFFRNRDFINMIRGCFIPRTAFRISGTFTCPLNGQESVDHCTMGLELDKDFDRYRESGVLLWDGTNNMWGVSFEGSHFALFECGHMYNPLDEESSIGTQTMLDEGEQIQLKTPLAISWMAMGDEQVQKVGPLCGNVQNWQRQIKRTFDPNTVSDIAGYISPD